MSPNEKLSAIYRMCKKAKEEGAIDESVIDQVMRIITFDKHDTLDSEVKPPKENRPQGIIRKG